MRALLVSGSLGALIGLERQWELQAGHPGRRVTAGVRTFALWGLMGTICAYFAKNGQPLVFVAGLLSLAAWLAIFLYLRSREKSGAGFTTAATGVLTYLLGGLVFAGEQRTALVLAVVTLLLLAGKPSLHRLSQNFTPEDARMALQFLAVTGAILPLVPDQDIGPFGAFNPRSVWLMVVMVSGVGFAGYIAVRMLGATRGIALTGLAGGLASSTATTLSMSKLSRSRPELSRECTLALILACTVMLWRVEVLVLAVSPALALKILPEFVLMSLPGGIYSCVWLLSGKSGSGEPGTYKNPLSLRVALQFGLLYAVVVFAVKMATVWFGGTGLVVASFISGLTDLDAISLSLSNLLRDSQIAPGLAAQGVVLAAVANSIMKAGLAAGLGAPSLRQRVLLILGSTAAIGLISIGLRWLIP